VNGASRETWVGSRGDTANENVAWDIANPSTKILNENVQLLVRLRSRAPTASARG
jgi:hypothetical protein